MKRPSFFRRRLATGFEPRRGSTCGTSQNRDAPPAMKPDVKTWMYRSHLLSPPGMWCTFLMFCLKREQILCYDVADDQSFHKRLLWMWRLRRRDVCCWWWWDEPAPRRDVYLTFEQSFAKRKTCDRLANSRVGYRTDRTSRDIVWVSTINHIISDFGTFETSSTALESSDHAWLIHTILE